MEDIEIIDLYFERSETAISETAFKYGSYCFTIASNILGNNQDAEECVNDTYMNVWKAIPPKRPLNFKAFIGKITRNVSLNKYKSKNTEKRRGFLVIAEEFEECFPTFADVEDEFDSKATGEQINEFLRRTDKESRIIFLRRYWYGDSIKQISRHLSISQSKVKSNLFRTRNKLKSFLESEEIL